MPRATMERRKGKLTGHKAADCTVTISKMDGVESRGRSLTCSPLVPDRNYTLTVAGESSTSRWRRDRNGWATERRPGGAATIGASVPHVAARLRCISLAGLSGVLHRTGGRRRADDCRRGLADVGEGAGTGAGMDQRPSRLRLVLERASLYGTRVTEFPTRQERSRSTS